MFHSFSVLFLTFSKKNLIDVVIVYCVPYSKKWSISRWFYHTGPACNVTGHLKPCCSSPVQQGAVQRFLLDAETESP